MSQEFFQLLSRVHTFTTRNWPYVNNKQLCPYRLASFGYMINTPYVLQCCVCHHQVIIPEQLDVDYSEVIEQTRKHKQNCIYFGQEEQMTVDTETAIKKEQIYLLMDEIMLQLKQGANVLAEKKEYPALNTEQIQKALAEDFFTFKSIDQGYKLNWKQQAKISFFLQFFGWNVKKDQSNQNNLNAECILCGRKVSLNNVKFIQSDQQPKSLYLSEDQCFSPVSQHRYFCLWVNSKCSGYKGYTIYIQHLFDKINQSKSLFSKRPPEETKKIRVELDKYLQSFKQKTSEQFEKIKAVFNECQNMKNSIVQDGQSENEKPLFEQSEKRMKEFVNDFIGDEIKEKVKKIKLA